MGKVACHHVERVWEAGRGDGEERKEGERGGGKGVGKGEGGGGEGERKEGKKNCHHLYMNCTEGNPTYAHRHTHLEAVLWLSL